MKNDVIIIYIHLNGMIVLMQIGGGADGGWQKTSISFTLPKICG